MLTGLSDFAEPGSRLRWSAAVSSDVSAEHVVGGEDSDLNEPPMLRPKKPINWSISSWRRMIASIDLLGLFSSSFPIAFPEDQHGLCHVAHRRSAMRRNFTVRSPPDNRAITTLIEVMGPTTPRETVI